MNGRKSSLTKSLISLNQNLDFFLQNNDICFILNENQTYVKMNFQFQFKTKEMCVIPEL